MNAPDKCPRCGADKMRDGIGRREYICESWVWNGGSAVAESKACLVEQRHKLETKVKELEAQLHTERIKSAAAFFDVEVKP